MEKKKYKDEDHLMRLEIEYNDLQQLHDQLYSADIL
jgi:hypothetical protein